MGNMTNDRRPHQEPQKADGRNGSQRHAGNHFPGFPGHAVAERDNGRGAKTHQQKAQRTDKKLQQKINDKKHDQGLHF